MLQIGQGVTSPNDWVDYAQLGIYVDVDTSACGFSETPHYHVSLEGEEKHWCANGVNSIYQPTKNGFRVYLRWTDDNGHYSQLNPLRANHARKLNWHLKWTGILTCLCKKKENPKDTSKSV